MPSGVTASVSAAHFVLIYDKYSNAAIVCWCIYVNNGRYRLSPQRIRPCQTIGRCATDQCQRAHALCPFLSTSPSRSAAVAEWARRGGPGVIAALCQDQVQHGSPFSSSSLTFLRSILFLLQICLALPLKLNRPSLVFMVFTCWKTICWFKCFCSRKMSHVVLCGGLQR